MSQPYEILSFYKFVDIEDPTALQADLKKLTQTLNMLGTILLAKEGINGMVTGSPTDIEVFKSSMHENPLFSDLLFKANLHDQPAFSRMLVKVKNHIITLRKEVEPTKETGEYLSPKDFLDWQNKNKDMIILDTRNDYEVEMGTFQNAVNPDIQSFDQFPEWVDQNLENNKKTPIVTFCTGGIRCEKATAYMKQKGFESVYQLDGGIITYFEETKNDPENNYWVGECTVFDKRKAITKTLEPSTQLICYVCLTTIKEENLAQQPTKDALCITCAKSMKESQEKRTKKGIEKSTEFHQKRANFLHKERIKYSVKFKEHQNHHSTESSTSNSN
ncbi:MAG: rhodanese-related sulfurtransferase [Oligoflexales bacterium]